MLTRRAFVMAATAAALLPVALVGCGSSADTSAPSNQEQEPQVNMANPFVDCASAYDAAQLAGFDVTFPESVPGYDERLYQAIEGKMAQCFYSNGDKRVLVRKALGDEDISGDYNTYGQVTTVPIGELEVTEKGDGGLVHVATWSRDGFSFAIDADEGLEPTVVEWLVTATL